MSNILISIGQQLYVFKAQGHHFLKIWCRIFLKMGVLLP